MMILEFTYPLNCKKFGDLYKDNRLDSNPIISEVDKLHKEIKAKYEII
jgi:hypothetical protein